MTDIIRVYRIIEPGPNGQMQITVDSLKGVADEVANAMECWEDEDELATIFIYKSWMSREEFDALLPFDG